MVPVACRPGGVLRHAGPAEAADDLLGLAEAERVAVTCEVIDDDGEMARPPRLLELAAEHGLPVAAVGELVAHRRARERLVRPAAETPLPLAQGAFRAIRFEDVLDGRRHLAAVVGDLAGDPAPLVHVHPECLTGDALGSLQCACRSRLDRALELTAAADAGAVVYLSGPGAARMDIDQAVAAQILRELGPRRLRLLSDSPAEAAGLERHALRVVERVSLDPGQRRPTCYAPWSDVNNP